MFTRILLSVVVLFQLSACIANPRILSQTSEDYEPPAKEKPRDLSIEQPKIQINEQLREEIRRQVEEKVQNQNSVQSVPQK